MLILDDIKKIYISGIIENSRYVAQVVTHLTGMHEALDIFPMPNRFRDPH